ncbi:MAG: hypothetical protein K6B38_13220 [Ruminococcus sp.]|nr:hypothetical protein [Ruminococcus sp.]
MDRFDKHTEYIMKRGKKIIAERKRRAKMIKRFSMSGAGVIAAAIVGIFTLHSAPSAPERIPVVSEVISTTSGYVSDTVTTVSATAQTKAAKTTVATTTTTLKAKEVTTNLSRSEMTATDTTLQATQTMAVASVVQSEVIFTSLQPESTSTALSSIVTISQLESTQSTALSDIVTISQSEPMLATTSNTTTSESDIPTTTTSNYLSHDITTMVPINELSDIVGYGKEIVYQETTYTSESIVFSIEAIYEKIGEYGNIPICSTKMFSPKIKIALGINDMFYIFSNNNYSVNNLKEFIIDTGWDKSGYYIEYGITGIGGQKVNNAINEILFSDAEMSEYLESVPYLSGKQAIIYSSSPFTIVVYENGYLKTEVNGKMIYFKIGEEKAESFFEYINQTV